MSADDRARERVRHLLMAEVDRELSAAERRELEQLLAEDPAAREERERMARVREVTSAMTMREPPEEIWDSYWQHVYNRVERGLGWILFSAGVVILLVWGTWHAVDALLASNEIPPMIKLAMFLGAAGGLVLLWSVFREKMFTRGRDPYREVQR